MVGGHAAWAADSDLPRFSEGFRRGSSLIAGLFTQGLGFGVWGLGFAVEVYVRT